MNGSESRVSLALCCVGGGSLFPLFAFLLTLTVGSFSCFCWEKHRLNLLTVFPAFKLVGPFGALAAAFLLVKIFTVHLQNEIICFKVAYDIAVLFCAG